MSDTDTPSIELDTHLHLMRSACDLAKQIGVSRNYLTAMRFHGFSMPGGKASLVMARQFISSTPKFKVRERPQDKPLPPAASSDRAHAQALRNAQRKPSFGTRKSQPRTTA